MAFIQSWDYDQVYKIFTTNKIVSYGGKILYTCQI